MSQISLTGSSSFPACCSSMYQTPLSGSSSIPAISQTPLTCMAYPDCGFRQPGSGVVLSCLDCFLQNGPLYRYTYGVSGYVFCAKVRGGTCTTAMSDEPDRAMYLLHNGFGKYNVFKNNCEDLALYCKLGHVIAKKAWLGISGQTESVLSAGSTAVGISIPLIYLVSAPVSATVTAVTYSIDRYVSDIGQRRDVVRLNVEDLVAIWGLMNDQKQESQDNESTPTRVGLSM